MLLNISANFETGLTSGWLPHRLPNFARRPNTGLRGTEPAWRFRRVFHQVRHPLKVVRSRANRIGMMVAPLAYSNPYLFRDAFGYAPGFPPPDELAAWRRGRVPRMGRPRETRLRGSVRGHGVAATPSAASPRDPSHGISTWQPRRCRDPSSDYPRGSRGGAAIRPRTIHGAAAAPPPRAAARRREAPRGRRLRPQTRPRPLGGR